MISGKLFTGRQTGAGGDRIKESANSPFYIAIGIYDWSLAKIDGTWEFLPTFMHIYETAGVNGISSRPDGTTDSRATRMKMQEQGFTILPHSLGYVQEFTTLNGGIHYRDIWQTPRKLGNKIIWSTDEKALNKFKREIIKNGHVPVPDQEIKIMLANKIGRRIDRRIKQQHLPEIKKEITELKELLKNIDKAFSEIVKKEVV